jgi:Ca2+-binding EF-hand superfamily protein
MRDLKVEKKGTINNTQIFEVTKVLDKEANQEKLNEILKRMK